MPSKLKLWLFPLCVLLSRLIVPDLQGAATLVNTNEAALRLAMSAGGTVNLNFNGTLTLTNTLVVSNSTTLDGTGFAVVLSGGTKFRLFLVKPGAVLTLRNLGIFSGRPVSTNAVGIVSPDGGAIYNDRGTVQLFDSTIQNNAALGLPGADATTTTGTGEGQDGQPGETGRGGAIFNNGGNLTVSNCVLSANAATGGRGGNGGNADNAGNGRDGGDGGSAGGAFGGAIFNLAGNLLIYNSTFGTNSATSGSGGAPGAGAGFLGFNGHAGASSDAAGGVIYNDRGQIMILNSTFAGNAATGAAGATNITAIPSEEGENGQNGGHALGGALFGSAGLIWITNGTFFGNSVLGGSGGAGGVGGSFGNDGGAGGAGGNGLGGALYFANGAEFHVGNSTFSDNSVAAGAGGAGGAAGNGLAKAGSAGNAGIASGGAIYSQLSMTLINSIMNNSGGAPNIGGIVLDQGGNISSDLSLSPRARNSRSNTDPLLLPLAQNGGRVPTMAISTNSPAREFAVTNACPPLDARGFERLGACDSGAYELGGTSPLAVTFSLPIRVTHGTNTNNVSITLQWAGFTVETSPNVIGPWAPVTSTAQNGFRIFTQPATEPRRFFRRAP